MTPQAQVVALVATRFRPEPLARLLDSLHQQSARPLVAVVCDNGSDPATAEIVQKSPLACELVCPGKNLGFGGGLAAAGQLALERHPGLSHLLVVDDDASLAPGDLEKLLVSAAKHSAGAIAPFLVDESGKLREVPEPVAWPLARAFRSVGHHLEKARALAPDGYPMAWCIGSCLLVARETWLRAGPPRPDMLAYGDDIEFSLRLSAISPAWAEPSVTVMHAPPAASQPPSPGMPGLPPPPAGADPYKKFGMLLQNLAFTCVISPRPRHLPLYLPGNAKRFLRTFGLSPANLFEVFRRYLKGLLGIPGGK